MTAPLRVRLMTNRQGGFYEALGPFLSRRDIVKELGGPVWDDDGKTWSVAISGGKAIACVGVMSDGKVQSLYVIPERRREGIATRLLEKALATSASPAFTATATAASVPVFEGHGFTKIGERGCYTLMERT